MSGTGGQYNEGTTGDDMDLDSPLASPSMGHNPPLPSTSTHSYSRDITTSYPQQQPVHYQYEQYVQAQINNTSSTQQGQSTSSNQQVQLEGSGQSYGYKDGSYTQQDTSAAGSNSYGGGTSYTTGQEQTEQNYERSSNYGYNNEATHNYHQQVGGDTQWNNTQEGVGGAYHYGYVPTQPYYYYQPYYYQTTSTNYQTTPTNYQTTPTNYQTTPTSYQATPTNYQTTPTSAVPPSTTSWNPVAWQPVPQATPTRGGEWPQWAGHTFSVRGRGSGSRARGGMSGNKPSRWDTPTNTKGNYSSVPPPESLTTPTLTTPKSAAPTESIEKTDDANTPVKDWPPGLQEYMVRSFESCSSEEEKSQVEKYLKIEINEMFRDKRVWTVDWDLEPLPLEKLKRQAQKRKSRWDTPSPSSVATPSPPNVTTPTAISRRGKKGKRGRGGRGGKFFIDRPVVPDLSDEDRVKVGQRAARFAKGSDGNKKFKTKLSIEDLLKTVSVSGDECDWESFCIEGTCTNLEKQYLRLTSAPDPRSIRPLPILYQSLSLVLQRNEEGRDYRYICEQFKSIRQDLTIQGFRNQFTVQVYESHGRIALKNGDWSEFNQCQSQLNALYGEGLFGSKAEFLAYKILYHMMTSETAEFVGLFCAITRDLTTDPAVKHALDMLRAWSAGNYYRFFKLYHTIPNQGRHLVDLFIERERKAALRIMSKAYRPTLSIEYISSILSFSSLEACRTFLNESCDAVFDPSSRAIDCRLTYNKLTVKS